MTTTVNWKRLAEPFPAEKVKQKRGQGGKAMSYISHGLVTERLNDVDPSWSSEVLTEHTYKDAQGRLHCEGVTIRLTVGGVSREEAGGPQRQDGFANEIKNAYSDALKRAAMRFGVALSMWESLVDSEYDEDVHPDYEASPVSQPGRSQPRGSAPAPARHQVMGTTSVGAFDMSQPMISSGQMDAITSLAKKLNVIVDDRVVKDFEKGSLGMLTRDEAGELIGALDKEWAVEQAATRQQKQKELAVVGSAGADQHTR